MSNKFNVGDTVQRITAADAVGVIQAIRFNPQTNNYFYTVSFSNGPSTMPEQNLRKYVPTMTAWDELASGVAAGIRVFRRSLTHSRVTRPTSRIAKSFSSARTQFYPHQFKPLLKLLDSPHRRILIGDDVGLGKTIEAGYILTELEAARRLEQVLIVVPSRLCLKWQTEFKNRFGLSFDIADSHKIQAMFGDNQNSHSFRWIVAYETIRNHLDLLKQSTITVECLIFDEAHRMRNASSNQHKVGALLCKRSDVVIMLSATPIQNSITDLFNLAHMLLPKEFPQQGDFLRQMGDNQSLIQTLNALRLARRGPTEREAARRELDSFLGTPTGQPFADSPPVNRARKLIETNLISSQDLGETQATLATLSPLAQFFTRTRKVEAIPNTAQRDAQWMSVPFSDAERQLYENIINICRQNAATLKNKWAQATSVVMAYRAVASCIPAAMRYYKNITMGVDPKFEELGSNSAPETVCDADVTNLTQQVRDAIRRFDAAITTDSKFNTLTRKLNELWDADIQIGRPRRKCIIFSYFPGTVEYLHERLNGADLSSVCVHGGIPINDRGQFIDRFLTDPTVQILVTSDVSAEGVDLQVASVVFNYDLPWNPMVVEQRIGRIDRIGQEARVLTIINIIAQNSIEERILGRLFDRIDIFRNTIGDLDAILGEMEPVEQLSRRALFEEISDVELDEKIERASAALEQQKQAANALDARAGELLAIDQVLLDEIAAARGEHQIPTALDLFEFVNESLRETGSGVVISSDALSRPYKVDLRAALQVRRFSTFVGDNEKATQFIRWAEQGPISLTFSRDAAYRHPNVELIHPTHPLARWASEGASATNHAFSLALERSEFLTAGRYIVALCFVRSTGAQSRLRVAGVATRYEDGYLVLQDQQVVGLVGELLTRGEDERVPWGHGAPPVGLNTVLEATQTALDGIVDERNRVEREMADLREAARRDIVRRNLEAALIRQQSNLEELKLTGAAEFATRMQEAKVRLANERLDAHTNAAMPLWIEPERDDIAVGIINVRG